MNPSSTYLQIISGQRRGPVAILARAGLRVASWPYRSVIAVRNAWYEKLGLPIWLDVPVVSVGNLTVGGTGKTPMTLWLCRRLIERGLKPAVLSRGYGASDEGLADEMLMVSRSCPEAVAVANPDRAAAGELAIGEYDATAIVLDDAFQHRRIGRDLDIVLVDATRPFGFGYLLPRGLLREPMYALLRAEAVVLTRCDQCEPARLDEIRTAIAGVNPLVPVVRAMHQPAGFTDLAGGEASPPTGSRVGCFAGIARPEAFERTLVDMDIHPTERCRYPDHHVYTSRDVESLHAWIAEARLDALVTTEKDAVKLGPLGAEWPVPIVALRVEMTLLDDGDRLLNELIDTTLREHAEQMASLRDAATPSDDDTTTPSEGNSCGSDDL